MSELFKNLSAEEIKAKTEAGGVDKAVCGYVQNMCNFNWLELLTGGSIFDAVLGGGLDCGTCDYWAEECGWDYVWSGSGDAWTGGCSNICTCH